MLREMLKNCRMFAEYNATQQVKAIKVLLSIHLHPVIFMAMVVMILAGARITHKLKR